MPTPAGTFDLGPRDATLLVTTGRTGPAARMGHDLEIRVNTWSARLELSDDPVASSLSLQADSRSLEVLGAVGNPDALSAENKVKIAEGLERHTFKGTAISFLSRTVEAAGSDGKLTIGGDLTLAGTTRPISFSVTVSPDGSLSGAASVVQTAFGIKPHSVMGGALKVEDTVRLSVSGRLPAS